MLCVLGTLIALTLQTVLFQQTSSRFVYEETRKSSYNSLSNMQDDIYAFIKSIENNLQRIYLNAELTGSLASGDDLSDMRLRHNRAAYNMAVNEFQLSQNLNALYIYTASCELVSLFRHASTPRYTYPEDIFAEAEQSNAQIVKGYIASDNRTMLISSYYNARREDEMVRFVLKIFADNGSRMTGFIVCDLDGRTLRDELEKYSYSPEQVVWLQPLGDRPAASVGQTGAQAAYYDSAAASIESGVILSEDPSVRSVFFEIPQREYNLTAFSLTPQFLLEESQLVLSRNLMITAATIIIVFSIVSALTSNMLVKPLTAMVGVIDRIKNGETALRVSNARDDELGRLGSSFNDMLDRIEALITSEYQAKLQISQAELKALQAQVNPHFLYNTLDTMSAIASSQQCDMVSLLCKALSNMFRYSLDMKDPLSTVENEIINIKNYLFVMNTRMGNSIDCVIDIDGAILNERIPRISIQPLVENAILHGLKNKHGEKHLRISGAIANENLVIRVEDNGVGMDAEAINESLRRPGADALEKSASIGLSNIHVRAKLLFGGEYGVTVYSSKGEGSRVELIVPRSGLRKEDV